MAYYPVALYFTCSWRREVVCPGQPVRAGAVPGASPTLAE